MRVMISTLLVLGAIAATAPASAQTYGQGYPVCLHVFGINTYIECQYTSMAQCAATAAGRAAQCEPNPYLAQASMAPVRAGRHARQVY